MPKTPKNRTEALDDLEQTQAALRDSIEESKKLTEKSQELIDKMREQQEQPPAKDD